MQGVDPNTLSEMFVSEHPVWSSILGLWMFGYWGKVYITDVSFNAMKSGTENNHIVERITAE